MLRPVASLPGPLRGLGLAVGLVPVGPKRARLAAVAGLRRVAVGALDPMPVRHLGPVPVARLAGLVVRPMLARLRVAAAVGPVAAVRSLLGLALVALRLDRARPCPVHCLEYQTPF